MNINKQLDEGQKEYGIGSQSNYFSFKKGENRLRVLTAGEVLATHFFGKGQKASTCYGVENGCPFHGDAAPKNKEGKELKPSIKYVCYIINKNDDDNQIQLADLPYSVIKQIGALQENSEYSFDTFPMPYDVIVTFNPDSDSPVNMYKVVASRKNEAIKDDTLTSLAEYMSQKTPKQHVQSKKNWQIRDHQENGLFVSEEKRQAKKKEWRQKINEEQSKKIAEGTIKSVEPVIDYPDESIHPDDIPF